jgi:uncharacterized protein
MRWTVFILAVFLGAPVAANPQSIPDAISTDPPSDAAHPAKTTVLHIPSHGVLINGLLYSPPGAGPHPTLVICHGLPGNEKNLDLAQAVRRAGWNAVTFNYRGSWGSPGVFRFTHTLEDADAVLAYLRDPANSARLGIDVRRIAIAGHSMGGWVVARTAAHDHGLVAAIMISAADMGGEISGESGDKLTAVMADNMETLSGVTAQSMAHELQTHAKDFRLDNATAGLTNVPLLVLTSDDGHAPATDAFVAAIKAKGGTEVTADHVGTDHNWSDRRIALQSAIINWLAAY